MNRFLSSQPGWWAMARERGLVQGEVPEGTVDEPSVLVIAMAMLGVLACMVPLGAFLLIAFDGSEQLLGAGGVVLSLLMLAAGGALLRNAPSVFLSCSALVLWGLGGSLLLINLAFNLDLNRMEHRPVLAVFFALAAVMLMLGGWLSRLRWIQSVMGVGWAVAFLGLLDVLFSGSLWLMSFLDGPLVVAVCWLVWLRGEAARLEQSPTGWRQPRWAVFADAAMVGVLCALVISRLWMPIWFELFGLYQGGDFEEASWVWARRVGRGMSVAEVLVATGLLVWGWRQREVLTPPLKYMLLLAGGLLSVCAWFSPSLGTIALIAAAALLGARWRIAVLCALLALYLLGRFYYQIQWTLLEKGVGVAVLGGVLLVGLLLLRFTEPQGPVNVPGAATPAGRARLGWVLLGALLVFGAVNWDVRGKEQVIAQGQRILVPLVPVDPRSLMQGDYMALRFDLPEAVSEGLERLEGATAYVRAAVNAKGVATVTALADQGSVLEEGEILLPLKRLKGSWVLVTDAYFFPEGQGEHFAKGRFGDFRVLPDGRALLVGLADERGNVMERLAGHAAEGATIPDEGGPAASDTPAPSDEQAPAISE